MNRRVEVTQRAEFSCSYVVNAFDDEYILNSHDYKFEATVCGEVGDSSGIVISFEDLSALIKQVIPDKYFLYDVNDEKQKLLSQNFASLRIYTLGFGTYISAEVILEEISLMLLEVLRQFSGDLYLKETKLRENNNSYVTWTQEG